MLRSTFLINHFAFKPPLMGNINPIYVKALGSVITLIVKKMSSEESENRSSQLTHTGTCWVMHVEASPGPTSFVISCGDHYFSRHQACCFICASHSEFQHIQLCSNTDKRYWGWSLNGHCSAISEWLWRITLIDSFILFILLILYATFLPIGEPRQLTTITTIQ